MQKKTTIQKLARMKLDGEKITALTAYDHGLALLLDKAGVDLILVGDSLGMVFQGGENTLNVTVDEIAYHTKAVRRGVKSALLVADMPFLSYHTGMAETIRNAGALIKAGAQAVKIEGAKGVTDVVERLVQTGIPVMGHIGLTPQSIHQLGGYHVQGKQAKGAREIIEQAHQLEDAGVFSIVLECIPSDLARAITCELRIPTIGIGAGPDCDGQILVTSDMLGMPSGVTPKFVKKYADLSAVIESALGKYVEETKNGVFPDEQRSYSSDRRRLKAI